MFGKRYFEGEDFKLQFNSSHGQRSVQGQGQMLRGLIKYQEVIFDIAVYNIKFHLKHPNVNIQNQERGESRLKETSH